MIQIIDSGKREKCRHCGKECIVWKEILSDGSESHYVDICECQAEKIKEKEIAMKRHLANIFSGKVKRFFPLSSCDCDIKNHTFEKFEQVKGTEKAFTECKKHVFDYFRQKTSFGLILIGDCGVGKSRLLKTMANEFVLKGDDVVFIEYVDIFDRIQATYKAESKETEKDIYDVLTNVKYLFVDELGVGGNSQDKEKIFLKVINSRRTKNLKTFFGMNPEGEEFLSKRVVSRLRELGQLIPIQAEDFRNLINERQCKLLMGAK